MHDAVLSYEAAGGIDKLRETLEWRDCYEVCKRDETIELEKKQSEADFKAIRMLHAKYAEKLYDKLFDREDGSRFYIIEDSELRKHFGEIISRIAGSHHWEINDVEKLGSQFAPIADFPGNWEICPIKLACVLRCADAGHIDDRRAPDHLLNLLVINGVSRDHWSAQNKLSQIRVDREDPNKAVIMSNICFREADFSAWNVAFDAVQVLDKELKMSNDLLKRNGEEEFQVKSVSGSYSRETLSQYIKTEGWQPYDAEIHISNVEKLIHDLGGEKLYGKDNKLEIVLRELIQNSRDSIVARRKVEEGFEGEIKIEITQDDAETWISVKDNGIGMSMETIKKHFLNFGSSFWLSDLAKQEYPGLISSGFNSVGQYGIGFYSIFMVASKVIVKTRKYDAGLNDTIQLKFPSGLCLRPIISQGRGESEISTEIRFLIDSKISWSKKYRMKPNIMGSKEFDIPYGYVLSNITAGLDVDVYYKELDDEERIIHKNINNIEIESSDVAQWLKDITYAQLRDDPSYAKYIDENYKRIRKIEIDGKMYGYAALNTCWRLRPSFFSILTVGGLANFGNSSYDGDYIGFLEGSPLTARRDITETMIDRSNWAMEQYALICNQGLCDEDKLYLPYVVGKYGIDMTDIMIIYCIDKQERSYTMNFNDIIKYMADNHIRMVLAQSSSLSSNRIEYFLDYKESISHLQLDELLFCAINGSGFLNLDHDDKGFPYNLYTCIDIVSKKLGIKVSEKVEENKAVSKFAGMCSALVLSFDYTD